MLSYEHVLFEYLKSTISCPHVDIVILSLVILLMG